MRKGRQATRRSADLVLHQLLAWRPGSAERAEHEIAAALRRGGLPTAGPFAAVVLAAPGADGPPGVVPASAAPPPGEATAAARALLEDLLPGALVGVLGQAVVALVPGAGDVVARLRAAVTGLADLPGLELPFGVSIRAGAAPASGEGAGAGTSSVAALSRAVAEARQAQQLAALLGDGVRLVDSAQFGSCELLLAMVRPRRAMPSVPPCSGRWRTTTATTPASWCAPWLCSSTARARGRRRPMRCSST